MGAPSFGKPGKDVASGIIVANSVKIVVLTLRNVLVLSANRLISASVSSGSDICLLKSKTTSYLA